MYYIVLSGCLHVHVTLHKSMYIYNVYTLNITVANGLKLGTTTTFCFQVFSSEGEKDKRLFLLNDNIIVV